jgi:uncharacterized protein (DUF1330 family)
MRIAFKISLVGALGFLAGASAVQVLHAQTAGAPAYLVVNIESVNDAATFAQYREAATKSFAPYGGHRLVRDATPVPLDSSILPEGKIVILQFPSMKALQDWWNSPAYTAVRPLREKSTVARLFAVEGLPTP